MDTTLGLVGANSIPLFDKDGNELQKYQGIVNNTNNKEVFSVVTKGYQIVQHDEVLDCITKSLSILNLKSKLTVKEMNNGARVHIDIVFLDISIDVEEGEHLEMRTEFDNSYDLTTGLRSVTGAFRLVCSNGLYTGITTGNYYHRHTKGLEIEQIQESFEKGIAAFSTDVKEYFLSLRRDKLDTQTVRTFLNDCLEDKKLDVGKKYIKKMIDTFENGGDVEIKNPEQVDSKWMLYNLISEVITHDIPSVDQRRSTSTLMNRRLNNLQLAA